MYVCSDLTIKYGSECLISYLEFFWDPGDALQPQRDTARHMEAMPEL